ARLTENLKGRILHHSFGYDMTLNQFFVIERHTASTVLARAIRSKKEGYFTGYETPDPSSKLDRVVCFRVRRYDSGGEYYFVSGRIYATLHDGRRVPYNELD